MQKRSSAFTESYPPIAFDKITPIFPLANKASGWVNWADWLGFCFLPFEKGRAYMRKLRLKNRDEYREWLKSGKRPKTVPHEPENIYRHTGWNGLGDWLGTGNIQNQKKKKYPIGMPRCCDAEAGGCGCVLFHWA